MEDNMTTVFTLLEGGHAQGFGYNLWPLVILNSGIFIFFALSFFKPKTKRDWRTFGMFSAFIVALFTEMYGFPLTVYLLSGWLQEQFPGIDLYTHEAGHLWHTLIGWEGNPHLDPFHILSYILIGGGFILLAASWKVLFEAQKAKVIAMTGPYARIRHPQYVGFVLIMLGFLFQWPTLVTLAMFPILLVVYWRLAKREEREVRKEFGKEYDTYAVKVPAYFPRLVGSAKPAK